MIYHSLKKNTEPMRFALFCEVSKYDFEKQMKKREDLDFDWDDFDSQFWDTSDDWGDLFDIYKADEKIIYPNSKDELISKLIKFEGTIDFDLDKLEPLEKELAIFDDYFETTFDGNIYYLGEKDKDLIGGYYMIGMGGWSMAEKKEPYAKYDIGRKKRYDSEGEEIPDDWDSDFLPEDGDIRT